MPTTLTESPAKARSRFQVEARRDLDRIAHNIHRQRPGPPDSFPDLRSMVAAIADQLFVEYRGRLPEDWQARVHNRARAAWRDYADKNQAQGITGLSGRIHRRRGLVVAAAELRDILGREPTADEILAHYNDSNRDTRVDARKQGAIASERDLGATVNVQVTDPTDTVGHSASYTSESIEDDVTERFSADEMIGRIEAQLHEDLEAEGRSVDGRLVAFASSYLRQVAEGDNPTWAELAKVWGVSTPTVCRWVRDVRKAAMTAYGLAAA